MANQPKTASTFTLAMSRFNTYLSQDFLGGPRLLKLSWVINFQKFFTFFFIGSLMYYYQHFSTAAWVYLGIHGSYGFCWLLKHMIFRDKSWEVEVTIGGALSSFLLVLGPYWVAPYLMISGVLGPDYQLASDALLMGAVVIHTMGVVIMMVSDAQKHYSLKYRSGLITDGMFTYIRHPNYTGEMMIYSAYALIVGHWLPWAILLWVWIGVFATNIKMKEASMSRYAEWAEYKKRTKYLIPWIF